MPLYPKTQSQFLLIYILGLTNIQTHTQTIMNIKKPTIKSNLASLVFVDKETNALVIHVHGFEDFKIAEEFANYMLKNSGMNYEPATDLFSGDGITLH